MLTLSDARRRYQPKIPPLLRDPQSVAFEKIKTLPIDTAIESHFPLSKQIQAVRGVRGVSPQVAPKIGVVYSGGPAPGGHNVVAGRFDTAASVIGFIGGPQALVTGNCRELKPSEIDHYRN